MRTELFRRWLRDCYLQSSGKRLAPGTQVSRLANCSTIERYEGDLDAHFERDGMESLLARLSYSAAEQTAGTRQRHDIPIRGDVANGSTTHRSAANLYRKFRVAQELAQESEAGVAGFRTTEKLIASKVRIGQQRYRYMVLERWDYRCAVTQASILLTASHIKPWRASTNLERLDPFNGICLSPVFDRAFDTGLITFNGEGLLITSPQLPVTEAKRLGLNVGVRLKGLGSHHLRYLEYHHSHIWRNAEPSGRLQ